MVRVHEEMYGSEQLEHVRLDNYLTQLVHDVSATHAVDVELDLDVAPIKLSGDRAMQVGLFSNEIISNAFKHSFNPRRTGRLMVRLSETVPGIIRLVIEDDGPGYDLRTTKSNMGSQLVQAFAGQLGGQLSITTVGKVRVELVFPLDFMTTD